MFNFCFKKKNKDPFKTSPINLLGMPNTKLFFNTKKKL